MLGEIEQRFNELVERNARQTKELARVARVIGRDGRYTERMSLATADGRWMDGVDAVNSLIDDLVRPTTEVGRVINAVAQGDLNQKMALTVEGQPLKGEFARIGATVNTMVDQLSSFADEVTRVAREVGTDGKLGGQAQVSGVSGTWKDLTDNVNSMASNLTTRSARSPASRRRSPTATSRRRSPSTRAARSSSSRTRSTRWSTSCRRSPPRSRASRARWAPRAASAARPR